MKTFFLKQSVLLLTITFSCGDIFAAENTVVVADDVVTDASSTASSESIITGTQSEELDAEDINFEDETGSDEPPEDDNFVPSIQITEDLPVTFPIDI